MVHSQPDDISKSFVYYFNMKYDILKNRTDEIYIEFEKAIGNKYPIDDEEIANDISGLNILLSKTITTIDLMEVALKGQKEKLDIIKGSIEFAKVELEEIEKSERDNIKERMKYLFQ